MLFSSFLISAPRRSVCSDHSRRSGNEDFSGALAVPSSEVRLCTDGIEDQDFKERKFEGQGGSAKPMMLCHSVMRTRKRKFPEGRKDSGDLRDGARAPGKVGNYSDSSCLIRSMTVGG